MKKIIYFTNTSPFEMGVQNKIRYQKKALTNIGYNVFLLKMIENKNKQISFVCNNEILLEKVKFNSKTFLEKIKKRIGLIKVYNKIFEIIKKEKIKKIYIRYPSSDMIFLNFLKKLKKFELDIYIEIPTYPYDLEIKNNKIKIILDKVYRQKLYKYVNKIVTFSEDKKIWNIPCINISNGIDLNEVKMIEKKEKSNFLVFTSVSNCSFWHGIDRFLLSLEKYGEEKIKDNIKFNIVGMGSESKKLKKIVEKSDYLKEIVIFHGFKSGNELDEIYNETDIGIGSLGRHRSGLYEMKALKNREYCAKGLPFIISERDPDFNEKPFVYRVTPNEELIDIKKIIEWRKKISISSVEIREFSKEFSWDLQMKKIFK